MLYAYSGVYVLWTQHNATTLIHQPTQPLLALIGIAMNSILVDGWAGDFSDFRALRNNGSVPTTYPTDNSTLPGYWARRARQAYWGATSFTDSNFGVVIKAAQAASLYDETIVIFLGDHGFQLGDNDQWSKVTNFEHATRIPLLIKLPTSSAPALVGGLLRGGVGGGGGGGGVRVSQLVETLDIFPTIIELAVGSAAGVPQCPAGLNASRATMLCTDGVSLVPYLRGSSSSSSSSSNRQQPVPVLHDGAFSQVPRGAVTRGMPGGPMAGLALESYMGYTVRTLGWRYTEWHAFNPEQGVVVNWTNVVAVELYRHEGQNSSSSSAMGSDAAANAAGGCTWDYEKANVAGNVAFELAQKELAALLCKGNPASCGSA